MTAPLKGSIDAFGDAPYYAGPVVCSRVPTVLNSTVFDNVAIS